MQSTEDVFAYVG